jgi:predicted dienelactone hydrolase
VRPFRFTLAAAFCFAATLVHASGLQFIDGPAGAEGPALTGVVWTPCATAVQEVLLRRLAVPGVKDCPIVGERLPLVVFSHGRAGWVGLHHDTAAALADAGFVVAAINHASDNAFDTSRVDELSYLTERTSDVKRLLDFMLGGWAGASRIDGERIGFFGHSRGGYTGLVVIGGNPNFSRVIALCADGRASAVCDQIRGQEIPARGFIHDPRIKAAVITDPGPTVLFSADDLKAIKVPVQLWSSEHGGAGVSVEGIAIIDHGLPLKPDYHVVPKAGHWAFLAPCSPEQAKAFPRSCLDAPGFDRVAFHKEFNAGVLAFFQKHLQP